MTEWTALQESQIEQMIAALDDVTADAIAVGMEGKLCSSAFAAAIGFLAYRFDWKEDVLRKMLETLPDVAAQTLGMCHAAHRKRTQ